MKSVVLYILMVGGLLIGIIAIIYFGQRIKPPISVGGSWEIDSASLAQQPCARLLKLSEKPKLTISQSGLYLSIRLDEQSSPITANLQGVTMSGQAGNMIKAPAGQSLCANYGAIELIATVIKEANQERLSGTLQVNDCQGCLPILFTATRVPAHR